MSKRIGEHALVVGAGMAGLASAAVLSRHYARVTVVDRDTLPEAKANRRCVPQGRHVHTLLAGGLEALKELFPGFEQDLIDHQAVRIQEGMDVIRETPFGICFPRVDAGFHRYALSRPLLEMLIRDRVRAIDNVEFLQERTVTRLLASEDGTAVVGVALRGPSGAEEIIDAEQVVDCAGTGGNLTMSLLESIGRPLPEEERVEVNVGYATVVIDAPDPAPKWKGLITLPKAPSSSRGAITTPIEGGSRWMIAVSGLGDDAPPRERTALLEFVRGLATPTLYELLESAEFHGPIVTSRFKQDRLRHFERLAFFPRGLLPVGDVICLLNPALGQGMSVALQEVVALAHVMDEASEEPDPLADLAMRYFAELPDIVEGPWTSARLASSSYPSTRGELTPDLETTRQVLGVLTAMLLKDPEVLKLECEVRNLLKPFRVIRETGLWDRALTVMRSNEELLAGGAPGDGPPLPQTVA